MEQHSVRKPRLSEGEIVADRYRIDSLLGRGGFGEVYRAIELATGAEVAVKMLLANYSSSDTDSRRFRREATLVKELNHPNIVQLLDFGHTDTGVPFIAFELLRGRALHEELKTAGAMATERATAIAKDILRALKAAHERGIIHRDIKPQNVFLLDEAPYTKVLDFGVAKALTGGESKATQLTESGQMIGTPHYMAPEQVRGSGIYPSSDLYALGLLLAEMLTGERVIKEEAIIDVYMVHISPEPFPLAAEILSSPLAAIIQQATAKVPALRYASAAEMLAALERLPCASVAGRERAATTRPRLASVPRTAAMNAFASPEQIQNLGGTVIMDDEAPPDSSDLGPPFAEAAPSLGSGTVVMPFPDREPARAPHGSGRQAMMQMAVSEPAPDPGHRPGRHSFMQTTASTAEPSSAAPAHAPPALSAGGDLAHGHSVPRTHRWPAPHEPTSPQAHAIAMAQLATAARPQKAGSAIWLVVVILVLIACALGLSRWAPWE